MKKAQQGSRAAGETDASGEGNEAGGSVGDLMTVLQPAAEIREQTQGVSERQQQQSLLQVRRRGGS